jgi:hypothetical protein
VCFGACRKGFAGHGDIVSTLKGMPVIHAFYNLSRVQGPLPSPRRIFALFSAAPFRASRTSAIAGIVTIYDAGEDSERAFIVIVQGPGRNHRGIEYVRPSEY